MAPGNQGGLASSEIGNLARLLAAERGMTDDRRHIVSGLLEKRRELAGEIVELERQTAQKRADLAHVIAVLRLYDPKAATEEVRPKQLAFRQRFFGNGELSRHCLNQLREAEGLAISADDIAIAAMKAKAMPLGDDPLRQKLVSTTLAALKRLTKREIVEKIGTGVGSRWKLTDLT
jgi:hypothetical protein